MKVVPLEPFGSVLKPPAPIEAREACIRSLMRSLSSLTFRQRIPVRDERQAIK